MIFTASIPPTPTDDTPLDGFSMRRNSLFRSSNSVVILGPGIIKRSLNLERKVVQNWIRQNYNLLKTIRRNDDKINHPIMLVVMEELVCNTWAHLLWDRNDQRSGTTTIGLVRSSDIAAPQWQFMALRDNTLSLSRMTSNLMVHQFHHFAKFCRSGGLGSSLWMALHFAIVTSKSGPCLHGRTRIG